MRGKKSERKALSADWLAENWSDLSQRLRPYVRRHLSAGLRSVVSPDDVLQEVWIEAARQCDRFVHVDAGGLHQWLQRIARGKCVDAMRRMRCELRQRADATSSQTLARVPSLTGSALSPGHTPSDCFFRAEVIAGMQRALLTLDEPAHTMLYLYYFAGASEREIAERFRVSPNVVKGAIHRARQVLRVSLSIYNLDSLRHAIA